MTELGLRERKKLRTKQLIADTAAKLFAERGFDAVTVADIARAAEVSEKTVFNYFRTKEELVFSGMEDFGAALLQVIRERPQGVSVLTAFAELVVRPQGLLAADDPQAIERLAAVARMIAASNTLRARERQVFDDCAAALADALAEETGAADADIEPWVVANALIGVQRASTAYIHREVLAGRRGPDLVDDVLTQARRAIAVLEQGFGDYPG